MWKGNGYSIVDGAIIMPWLLSLLYRLIQEESVKPELIDLVLQDSVCYVMSAVTHLEYQLIQIPFADFELVIVQWE